MNSRLNESFEDATQQETDSINDSSSLVSTCNTSNYTQKKNDLQVSPSTSVPDSLSESEQEKISYVAAPSTSVLKNNLGKSSQIKKNLYHIHQRIQLDVRSKMQCYRF